jgi:hypothetical protein
MIKICSVCNKDKLLKFFYKNIRNKDGHSAECKKCATSKRKLKAKENAERSRIWYRENKEKATERNKKYAQKHIKKTRETKKRYKEKYPERVKKSNSEYTKKHAKEAVFKTQKRRTRKLQALPNWADLEKIKEIYLNCPDGMQVDHVIPFVHQLICGLHVENNLQYLSEFDNKSKGNKFEVIIEKNNV